MYRIECLRLGFTLNFSRGWTDAGVDRWMDGWMDGWLGVDWGGGHNYWVSVRRHNGRIRQTKKARAKLISSSQALLRAISS